MQFLMPRPRLPNFHHALSCRHLCPMLTALSCHNYLCGLFSLASTRVLAYTFLTGCLTKSPGCHKTLFKPSSTAASVQTFKSKHWHSMDHTQRGWGIEVNLLHKVLQMWPEEFMLWLAHAFSSWESHISLTSLPAPKDVQVIQRSSSLHLGHRSWNSAA